MNPKGFSGCDNQQLTIRWIRRESDGESSTSACNCLEWPSKGVPNSIMLEKPFVPAQLITAVANLLNTGAPTP
jgi:hypothetical protein